MTLAERNTLRDAIGNFVHSFVTFIRLMARNRVGFVGFLVVIGFVLLALVGPYFVELDTKTNVSQIYQPPSREHILGTDHQGRDIWAQIVHGGRDILYVAFLAGLLSTFIAVTFGALAALVGGVVDSVIMTITDIVLTIPQFPLLAVLAGFVRLNSLTLLAVLLAVLSWPTLLRAVRSQVLSLKERDYVEAAMALDMGLRHIIFAEILPNMMSYIIISLTLAMTGAIYAQVGLIFLGLVPMSGNNWAVMIQLAWVRGAIFFKDSIYYIMSPVLAIAFFQLALVSMTRSLEEVFNPRLRAGV
ncbi:MAG: ABC transporter permease [Chloroflexi bacterium]|nr:ABC transporter permease [Chloroflexota bacterium]